MKNLLGNNNYNKNLKVEFVKDGIKETVLL